MKLEYGGMSAELSIEYSRRKSLRISVEPPNNVMVAAPAFMKEYEIHKALKGKEGWIAGKLVEIKASGVLKCGKDYADGEVFMYKGMEKKLAVVTDNSLKKPLVELCGNGFEIRTNTLGQDKLKKAMEDWYRKRTYELVVERVACHQRHFEQKPLDIRVKRQKRRWGSCSSARRINFNLKCSMAPPDVLDYIVVHEMCHMVHFNHSGEFWKLVERIMPEYRERKNWLKKHGIRMQL